MQQRNLLLVTMNLVSLLLICNITTLSTMEEHLPVRRIRIAPRTHITSDNRGILNRYMFFCLIECHAIATVLLNIFLQRLFTDGIEATPLPRRYASDESSCGFTYENYLSMIQYFISLGADVNAIHPVDGSTPLILATRDGHDQAAKFLLSNNADPRIQDASGKTAIDYAHEATNIFDYLEENIGLIMRDSRYHRTHLITPHLTRWWQGVLYVDSGDEAATPTSAQPSYADALFFAP